jgi:hypothetical protein
MKQILNWLLIILGISSAHCGSGGGGGRLSRF